MATSITSINYYWPVYLNLEKEFLSIADIIHVSDDQLKVYSMRIADMLVRTAVEIEAIAKELYFANGGGTRADGKAPYFDTDCMEHLENLWHMGKKVVLVTGATIYLQEESNRRLTPLHKANKRGSKSSGWNKAYQAVKHDRVKSLRSGNLENLLHALAALYLLNLYYKDEEFSYSNKDTYLNLKDYSFGSQLFSVLKPNNFGLNIDGTLPTGHDFDAQVYYAQPDAKLYQNLAAKFQKMNADVDHQFKEQYTERARSFPRGITQEQKTQTANTLFKEIQNKIINQRLPILGREMLALPYKLKINKHNI